MIRYKFEDGKLTVYNKIVEIPNIKLIRVIGEGANAVCFEADKLLPKRKVAIKIWLPRDEMIKSDMERFIGEINKTAKLNSEKVVQIYNAGSIDNIYYAELEYIPGITLRCWLKASRTLGQRCKVLTSLLIGIKECHRNNINLGDLHYENILVLENNNVKIIDLGTSVIATSQEDSLNRGKKLLLATSLQILPEAKNNNLLSKNILKYPIEIIRESIEVLNNLIWKIHHISNIEGDQLQVVIEIYSTITKLPLFNLREIRLYLEKNPHFRHDVELLYNGINNECDIELGRNIDEYYFGKRLSEKYILETEDKYEEWQRKFNESIGV
jgi:tRNA A-37 threonylcarbamoyl transferase component Bud32